MSYTLNQVELYALSETRRASIYDRVRIAAGYSVGQYLSKEESVSLLFQWSQPLAAESFIPPFSPERRGVVVRKASWCLDGATVDEYRLYTHIESQRIAIRMEEQALRNGASQYPNGELLRTLRADFKSFLKEVQL